MNSFTAKWKNKLVETDNQINLRTQSMTNNVWELVRHRFLLFYDSANWSSIQANLFCADDVEIVYM